MVTVGGKAVLVPVIVVTVRVVGTERVDGMVVVTVGILRNDYHIIVSKQDMDIVSDERPEDQSCLPSRME